MTDPDRTFREAWEKRRTEEHRIRVAGVLVLGAVVAMVATLVALWPDAIRFMMYLGLATIAWGGLLALSIVGLEAITDPSRFSKGGKR